MAKEFLVPYGKDGDMQYYPMGWHEDTGEKEEYVDRWDGTTRIRNITQYVGPNWRPNASFETTMKLIEMSRGRSAAHFIWEDENGRRYPMFMSHMVDLVQRGTIISGSTTGTWRVYKRGQNYGIGLMK